MYSFLNIRLRPLLGWYRTKFPFSDGSSLWQMWLANHLLLLYLLDVCHMICSETMLPPFLFPITLLLFKSIFSPINILHFWCRTVFWWTWMDTVDTWSHPRRQMLKLSHLIPVKEDYIPRGVCGMACPRPWSKMAAAFLNMSLMAIRENVLVMGTNYSCSASGIWKVQESNV